MPNYKKVFDPIAEGNPAPIANPNNETVKCIGECGALVDSADELCTDCWMWRHDARVAHQPGASNDQQ